MQASLVKNPHVNAGDPGSITRLGKSHGKGNGNPLQYSYLENSMDRKFHVTEHTYTHMLKYNVIQCLMMCVTIHMGYEEMEKRCIFLSELVIEG